jgi:3-oxoacyl-[acyl-carrier protein] reductase
VATVYLALGSNLGDPHANLAAAIAAMAARPDMTVRAVADPIRTDPVDCPPDSPPFLNSAACLETSLPPDALLKALKDIETTLGRRHGVRHSPRPIDLDILLYDDLVLDTPGLVIPHPRLHERRFVLEPLAQIAPDAMHPTRYCTVAQLLASIST